MKRILIVGTSGSGKTTLAHQLNKILQIPCHDLDEYHWLPNWQPREVADFQQRIFTIIEQPAWIISGNYSTVRTQILEKVDTIIWLDYSFSRCFWQAFRRSIHRVLKKQSCCNGNYESFYRMFFSKESLLLWIIKIYKRHKKNYQALFQNKNTSLKKYLRFSKLKETNDWLNSLNSFKH